MSIKSITTYYAGTDRHTIAPGYPAVAPASVGGCAITLNYLNYFYLE